MNKANLLARVGELVRDKKLEGISDLRDESDKSGMRVVIELKRGEVPEIVQNNLFKLTQLQDSFGMNMVALVDGQPRLLNLKEFLEHFITHRREVAMAADHVVVLDGARVVDAGRPQELAARSAAFARLFEIDQSVLG